MTVDRDGSPDREGSERIFLDWLNSPGCGEENCSHPEHQLEAVAGPGRGGLVTAFLEAIAEGVEDEDELVEVLRSAAADAGAPPPGDPDPASPPGAGE